MSGVAKNLYVPCFHCNSRPATIKCFTCRGGTTNPVKLCYRCDNELHGNEGSNHEKEFIPFTEMKSTKSKDIPYSFSQSSLRFDPSKELKSNLPKKIIDINDKLIMKSSINPINPINPEPPKSVNIKHNPTPIENPQDKELRREIELLSQELEIQRGIQQEKRRLYEESSRKSEKELQEQRQKNSQISDKIDQIASEYEEKIEILRIKLQELRGQYELKLKDFEALLVNSSETIKSLQNSVKDSMKKEDSEEIKTLRNELKIVNEGILSCEKSLSENKAKFESANSAYQVKMAEKDNIIEELSAINQLKQSEILKLDELVRSFEELFGHYQEEKDQLTAENEKINEELKKFNEVLQKAEDNEEEAAEEEENNEDENKE